MITPALLLLGSASLVASALVRMARVVDRARILIVIAQVEAGGIRVADRRRVRLCALGAPIFSAWFAAH
jgi:hypothetical protein